MNNQNKPFHGRAIYQPSGAAAEYSQWACNIFNGCSNKCEYCLSPDTDILMYDGTVKKLCDIEVGDEVFGVDSNGDGQRRHLSKSIVTNKVHLVKEAYEILLTNGVKLICSAEHRWLSDRGWKYTIGAETGPLRRPFLTENNTIYGITDFRLDPLYEVTDMYRRGYLFGIITGDANFKSYPASFKNRGKMVQTTFYRFRLALKLTAAVERTKEYLSHFGVETVSFLFPMKDRTTKETIQVSAIRTSSKEAFDKISSLIAIEDNAEFRRGFVAGFYDAEGNESSTLRIGNTDKSMLELFEAAIVERGFDCCWEPVRHNNRRKDLYTVRIYSKLSERIRFVRTFAPIKISPNQFECVALNAFDEDIKVSSIIKLDGERELIDISTTTENFFANGMVSHNCYNRHSMTAKVLGADEVKMKKQLFSVPKPNEGYYFDENFKRKRVMKQPLEIVTDEIDQNREAIIRDGGIFMSFVSDPLLPDTCQTTLEVLNCCTKGHPGSANPVLRQDVHVTILTKSAWWLKAYPWCDEDFGRDVRETLIAERDHLSLGFTLTGMDEMERHCISNTQERIDAMKWADEQGIYTWASIEPVIIYEHALDVIILSLPYCKEYRIGLASKLGITYDPADVLRFKKCVETTVGDKAKIVWKKSVLDKIK